MPESILKSIKLGKLRVNLAHLVWYTPTGIEGGEGHEEPSINLKTTDSASPVSIRYSSIQKREADLDMLDRIFSVETNTQVVEHSVRQSPPEAREASAPAGPSQVKLPAGLDGNGG